MNVSSVKNLNGETFSAVQDADLTTVVQTNSGNWNDISAYQNASGTYMPSGQFISAIGLDQFIRGRSTTANSIGFKIPDSTIDTPAVYLKGQFGSAYYKENELKLGRGGHTIAFNIGGGGPKISAGAYSTAPSYLYIYNTKQSATLSQSSILLSANDSTSGLVDIPSISAWNDTTDIVQANSGEWDRISALSGYSANGYQVKLSTGPTVIASAVKITSSGVSTFTGYLTVSSYPNWVSISNGSIYLYNTNRGLSAQRIRTDDILKWNNYGSAKLDTTAFSSVSSNWNDTISSYQNASGTYLTAVDLSPYATTAEVDTLSSMFSGAIDFVSANAGGEFPASADEAVQYVQTNSAGIDETVNSVSTNSGAWGGSALPISAGPGIKVNLVDNTLVFSNDETVLWSGVVTGGVVVNLSEPLSNFNKFVIKYDYWVDGTDGIVELESLTNSNLDNLHDIRGFADGGALFMNCFSGNNTSMKLTHNYFWNPPANQANKAEDLALAHLYEIRGIGRKQ